MKPSRRTSSYFSPFLLWNDLARKTADMMLASGQVIGHRTRRMASAGPSPSERDRREFALMSQEKIEASAQSTQAMATHLLTTGQRAGARAMQGMVRSTAAMMSLANSRTPGQLFARQAALARALSQSALSLAEVSKNATTLAQRGLKPIHAKATANAKRLARR